ncbi:MAG: Rpn family recombination-promoting nuclease/putative transposase [Bacilli bacterium]|nr:Rpn family recombination-promoting nuclease/putative transposase [Bacilli bacterium]
MTNQIYTLDNDYLFKKIFSQEKYLKHLLLNFFNVKSYNIEYLNTVLIKNHKDIKVGIVDMLLNIDGEIVILELQNVNRHNFKERLLFYSSNVIANYCLKEGENYNSLKSIKVYAIVNYHLFDNNIKNKVRLKVENRIFTKKMEYEIFDLVKIRESNKEAKYYELVSLFKINDLNKLKKIIKNELNKEILTELEKYNQNSEEHEKMEEIERLMMQETEHYEDAYIDGIEVGRSEGYSLGKTKGYNLGKNDGISQEKIGIAKNMLNDNIDIAIISKYTKLSQKEIDALR